MNNPKVIKYRSVYWVKLKKGVGAEIYKTRPCVIMSNDWQNTLGKRVVIIPFTTTPIPNIPFHIPIEFEGKQGKILPEQIRSVDKKGGEENWRITGRGDDGNRGNASSTS